MATNSNAKKDKKIQSIIVAVTILCTIIFILLAVFVGGGSADEKTTQRKVVGALDINDYNAVVVPESGYVYYSITPTTSGDYLIYSYSDYDTKATLYSSDWARLKSDDDSGSGSNFRIIQSLTADTTYYLAIAQSGSPTDDVDIIVIVISE